MPYFNISNGLRGCYMPDNAYIVRCDTRRALKAALEYEARDMRDAGFTGANKRAVASVAAQVWRDSRKARKSAYDFALPLIPPHISRTSGNYCYGVFVSHATRADYLAQDGDC